MLMQHDDEAFSAGNLRIAQARLTTLACVL